MIRARRRMGKTMGLVLALVAFEAMSLVLAPMALQAAADEPKLLMLPIVVHSAEDPDYLRSGLSDMLASRFERIGALELLRSDPESRGTTDPDRALALARKVDADFVLYGSFTRFGRGASLDVQCVPTGPGAEDGELGAPLREIFVHSGSIGEIIPDLDELAGKVSRFVRGERVEGQASPPVTGGSATPAIPAVAIDADLADMASLLERVAALEATVAALLEQLDEVETGSLEDLR
jgi:TolB-like protein